MTDDDGQGTLYGIGVGPGDPELLTLKGLRIIARVPVIAYIAPAGGDSLARAIVAGHLPGGQTEIAIPIAMGEEARESYDRSGREIAGHLEAGRDVAMLCEGDPFFYGSFTYLHERLAGSHRVRVVPGVSSLGAAAAAAGMALASREQALTVVPAILPEDALRARLGTGDAAAIVKVGRHLDKVRRVLGQTGRQRGALYVERATMEAERVAPLEEVEAAPYFSMILVPERGDGPPLSVAGEPPAGAALVALGPGGLEMARLIARRLPGASVHGPAGLDAEVAYAEVAAHLRSLFQSGTPIVGVMAAGIIIRALAPVIGDKGTQAPVVAVAQDGGAAVPLLGGHDGANRLALAVAEATGGSAAITTAGDVMFGLALDDPPPGWRLANREAAKGVSCALLAGEPVVLVVEAGDAAWLKDVPFAGEGRLTVRVTDRAMGEDGAELVLHPPVLALGVGCERGVDVGELGALARETLGRAGLAPGAVACVVSHELKSDEEAVHALARDLGVPARFFSGPELEAEAGRLANPSNTVFEAVGCHGVAEGAALAAAGNGGTLIVEKTLSRRATCAVARAPGCIPGDSVGRPRGRLAVVGIGPGGSAWRTPEASRALAGAAHVVGHGLYLDLIAEVITGKARHQTPLGEEEARAAKALELAAAGESVALVSSGDPGIFALATLVFELLERRDHGPWNRVAISVVPGVSAFQAAAARMGAPMGHDFCVISLSDLLTPWASIRRRLQAAAEGDFIVALYNPASKRRKARLAEARDILLKARAEDTPVVIARNLGREGEQTDIIRLGQLDPGHADMLSVILIGNSRTRVTERGTGRWVYTPRGYDVKIDDPI